MSVNLLGLDAPALAGFMAEIGEKPFRGRQLMRWVHRQGEDCFGAMSDLAKSFRSQLELLAVVEPPRIITEGVSDDGTRKWLLDVGNGNAVETVFIPEANRGTLCVSSQAGCTLACEFCSTGRQGFNRNLTTAEIIGQLWLANRTLRTTPRRVYEVSSQSDATPALPDNVAPEGTAAPDDWDVEDEQCIADGRVVSNVVLMGMGEPLLNFDNVVPALRLMLDDNAYGLSRRRVTVSTSGIVPLIDRLRDECPVALAVSLHASNDDLRSRLMPINLKYPLRDLLAACNRYLARAPRDFITFEYVMLAGINDSERNARELISLLGAVPSKVNLIPFNPYPGAPYQRSPREVIRRFSAQLNAAGIVTTIRKTRGDDIDAACGQLAGQVLDRTRRVIRLEVGA